MIEPSTYTAPIYSTKNSMGPRTAGYMPVFGQKHPSLTETASAQNIHMTQENSSLSDEAENSTHGFIDLVKDVIDVINPLQHLPIVGAIYRHITGDDIAPAARIAGSAIYGGPLGAAIGAVDVALEKITGKDMGETAFALIRPNQNEPATQTVVASLTKELPVAQATPTTNETEQKSSYAATPTHAYHAGMTFSEPAMQTTPASTPVLATKGESSADNTTVRKEFPANVLEDVTLPLHSQDAPAATSAPHAAVPPELIALKMMQALDKYQDMKIAAHQPLPLLSTIH